MEKSGLKTTKHRDINPMLAIIEDEEYEENEDLVDKNETMLTVQTTNNRRKPSAF